MTEFAHTYKNSTEAFHKFALKETAAFTIVLHKANGEVCTVDSDELPAYADTNSAIDAAMFSIKSYDDSCDVYHYGEYYGTAEYVDMTPNSWFSSMQVVFSMPC